MTTTSYISVNGQRVIGLRLTVPNVGPWVADLDLESDTKLEGRVTIAIDDGLKLVGTVLKNRTGEFALSGRARVVAGAAGWSTAVPPKDYHADNGVKTKLVAEDAARLVGEQLGTFIPSSERVGVDYVRQAGPAGRALDDARGGAAWWVDYDGVTHVGPRPEVSLVDSDYEMLAFDAREETATLAVHDPSILRIGSVLTKGLDGPHVIRYFELFVSETEQRVRAWCGGPAAGYGHIAGVLRSIIQHVAQERLFGTYRYRVIRMAGERVELQAVSTAAGLPDLLPISPWPGIAGAHAVLTPGAEVLVGFIEGSRAQPYVAGFAGADKPGFVAVMLTLGGKGGSPAARQGDVVEVQLPTASFTGYVGGVSATGVLTFTPSKALGLITSGSSKVQVAT
ncbi:MAG TPA: hypothetical protein VJU61_05540 [Polyangiaceae bacterium]|nr:hypothetical protein [Polyangiaceae bacterium]